MDIEEPEGRIIEPGGFLAEKVAKHLSISVGKALPRELSVDVSHNDANCWILLNVSAIEGPLQSTIGNGHGNLEIWYGCRVLSSGRAVYPENSSISAMGFSR